MERAVLHLVLKGQWFDMIDSEIKKEEYRDINPYWAKRFVNGHIKIRGKYYHPSDVVLCFSRGYSMNRIVFKCNDLCVGSPREGWCDDSSLGDQKYILRIGERIPLI